MKEREVLKLALEALESIMLERGSIYDRAITAIREALAQPEQEPVAWSYWQSCLNDDGTQTAPWVHRLSKFKPSESIINKDIVPLYTTPPASKPLTDDEFISMVDSAGIVIDPSLAFEIKEMVEAAHGIKE